MNDTSTALAVLVGLSLRIAVPVLITIVAVLALSRLDRHWQSEAGPASAGVRKPQCWKTQSCSAEKRKDCPGYKSAQPCWQVFRQGNGYLDQKCLGCPVLVAAPIPNLALK
jgi:hypothetical protein